LIMIVDQQARQMKHKDQRQAFDCGVLSDHGSETCGGSHGLCKDIPRLAEAMSRGDLPFLAPKAILRDLRATTKGGAVREILGQLAATGAVDMSELESTIAAILEREGKGSTGIGNGIAIPHASHSSVNREVGAVARSQAGIEFDSLDGGRVHLIFLLLSPPNRPADHIRALAAIAKYLRSLGAAA
jgi:PTS system fructose-specific IIA component/PTS system nitrogen regulatory IIA component